MSHQLGTDKKSAIRGRMGEVVNAVRVAAAKGARARPLRPPKIVKIRDRVRNFRRFRAEAEFDGATLVAMAMDKLTPALLRASIIGVPVTVEVPDERTAEVFRAALAMTRDRRPTDRLGVVVAMAS